MQIKNRVKELRQIKASELIPNDKNWRKHPKWQHDGMRAVLENIGYAGALIAYENEGQLVLIDGHLRQEMTPDEEVPVLILDVNEQEADILLATYDPLTAMANEEGSVLHELLGGIESQNDDIRTLLQDINERYSASAVMEVENATSAFYLDNQNATLNNNIPVNAAGKPHKAFLVHFDEEDHAEVMGALFTLGEAWGLDTVAEVMLKMVRGTLATSTVGEGGD
tara:strand:+ start:306 stop:977 length:672 start_codon:yes stop_codon:yes gene_type:complete